MNIQKKLEGKKILIWGYGREGKSTERFLKTCCSPLLVEIFEGKREGINEDDYDFIIKSPGIVMHEENPKYTSQTELFLEAFSDRVIGITGTKGKSTTSAMLYHVLSQCLDRKVIFLGNIGEPCLDHFEEITDDTVVVFEMSCHQLAHVKVSPHVGVFLNLYEEHLDYYGTFERYCNAKMNVAKFQMANDSCYVGEDVPEFDTVSKKTLIKKSEAIDCKLGILGEHNAFNATFVDRIATEVYGVSHEDVLKSLETFTGLAHRLQFVGKVGEVSYYDDSISTIPKATIAALNAVPNAQTVIIGGMDRGICYDDLTEFVKSNSQFKYIFCYASGKRIHDEVKDMDNCYYVEELKEAVELAKKITDAGKACILSPASASYGYFKDFEERGNTFQSYVNS